MSGEFGAYLRGPREEPSGLGALIGIVTVTTLTVLAVLGVVALLTATVGCGANPMAASPVSGGGDTTSFLTVVRASRTETPISGAMVYTVQGRPNETCRTDQDGSCRMVVRKGVEVEVRAEARGYIGFSVSATPTDGTKTGPEVWTFYLTPEDN